MAAIATMFHITKRMAATATMYLKLADLDILPVQRWMHLEKNDVITHAVACSVAFCLFFIGMVTYSRVKNWKKGQGEDNRKNKQSVSPDQPIVNPPSPDPRVGPPPPAPPTPSKTPAGFKIAIPERRPRNWRVELEKLELELREEKGTKLTKELCTVYLAEWGLLPEHFAAYHIISPAAGGKDHPANYAMLPNYFPTDYHIKGKEDLHHAMMLELLGQPQLIQALKAGQKGEAADADARERFAGIKKSVCELKQKLKGCATTTRKCKHAGAAAPADPATASVADPMLGDDDDGSNSDAEGRLNPGEIPGTPANTRLPSVTGPTKSRQRVARTLL